MTRPHIIRADTIDLQSQESPSAKDHSRQPAHPAPLGDGPPAPHQAIALKHVEQEASDLHLRSPRVSQDLSGKELQLLQNEGDFDTNDADGLMHDSYGLQRNGIGGSMDGDGGDGEGDDGLDDDMMDKISSSPSIEDGGYPSSLPWPNRGDSLVFFHTATEDEPPATPEHEASSSPFVSPPAHYPVAYSSGEAPLRSEDHHHNGEYTEGQDDTISDIDMDTEDRNYLRPLANEAPLGSFHDELEELEDSHDAEFDPEDFRHLLLPPDDPMLDNEFDDAFLGPGLEDSGAFKADPGGKPSPSEYSESFEDDDDTEDISYSPDSRFVDSGWGGECLRETEDIDFEFVYALHTFVATVEGQANATKGDTMVLLDDSNSYWWLVRIVKDSSIGYLPAEHIETPTERLARLNKHRNIDLSQTMLGDNPERSKNPLKKAMRSWNEKKPKTVQFTAPIYFEASDVEYSTEEEEGGEGGYFPQDEDGGETQNQEQEVAADEDAIVEPLNSRRPGVDTQMAIDPRVDAPSLDHSLEKTHSIDDDLDRNDNDASVKSRKGTVRNTDSFFKDDGVETRKINLTPSLLRDDSSNSTIRSVDPREPLKTRPSLDSLEKVTSPTGKGKEDKGRKEKKGMLSGLFKRKDRKGRSQDDDGDEGDRLQEDYTRASPQSKDSSESLPLESSAPKQSSQNRPQRQTSKLQKAPPPGMLPGVRSPPNGRRDVVSPKPTSFEQPRSRTTTPPPNGAPPSVGQIKIPRAFEEPRSVPGNDALVQEPTSESRPGHQMEAGSPKESRRGVFSPIKDVLLSSPTSAEPKPEKVKRAKHRMLMDEFDSDSSPDANNQSDPILEHSDQILEQERDGSHDVSSEATKERLSESPVQVSAQDSSSPTTSTRYQDQAQDRSNTPQSSSYAEQSPHERPFESREVSYMPEPLQDQSFTPQHVPQSQQSPTRPPGLVIDTSSQEEPSVSPVSPISSPELIDPPNEISLGEETPASATQPSNTLPAWNDASLRAYLENDNEIRDLLLVVHDKSNLQPAPPDHSVAKNLFKEENQRLSEMSNQLDSMLGGLLERRSKSRRR